MKNAADNKFSFSENEERTDKLINSLRVGVLFQGPKTEILFSNNAAGLILLKGNTHMGINGGVALPLPPHTSAGIYVLELSNDKVQFRQKILVEK